MRNVIAGFKEGMAYGAAVLGWALPVCAAIAVLLMTLALFVDVVT
jgi:hypothetical protein